MYCPANVTSPFADWYMSWIERRIHAKNGRRRSPFGKEKGGNHFQCILGSPGEITGCKSVLRRSFLIRKIPACISMQCGRYGRKRLPPSAASRFVFRYLSTALPRKPSGVCHPDLWCYFGLSRSAPSGARRQTRLKTIHDQVAPSVFVIKKLWLVVTQWEKFNAE